MKVKVKVKERGTLQGENKNLPKGFWHKTLKITCRDKEVRPMVDNIKIRTNENKYR